MTAPSRLPWGLFRRPDGALSVDFKAFADGTLRLLSSHATRPEAAAARDAQERADEIEALRAAGQRDLFGGGDAA